MKYIIYWRFKVSPIFGLWLFRLVNSLNCNRQLVIYVCKNRSYHKVEEFIGVWEHANAFLTGFIFCGISIAKIATYILTAKKDKNTPATYSVIHNSIAPSKELCSKMALGEVGVSLPWWCHTLVLLPPGYWGLFLNLIIFS